MTTKKLLIIILSILFVVLAGIKLVKLINAEKERSAYIRENCIEVSATVNQVMRSGTRNKLSTILQIEYMFDNKILRATIRRSGYRENAYNKGDTIKIFINPKNKDKPIIY